MSFKSRVETQYGIKEDGVAASSFSIKDLLSNLQSQVTLDLSGTSHGQEISKLVQATIPLVSDALVHLELLPNARAELQAFKTKLALWHESVVEEVDECLAGLPGASKDDVTGNLETSIHSDPLVQKFVRDSLSKITQDPHLKVLVEKLAIKYNVDKQKLKSEVFQDIKEKLV